MAQAYWQNFGKYQYARNHWWRPAAWAALGGWVAGSSWESPAYYDYGEGIYYEDEQVYMNGKPVASAEEYYQQASDLATSAPPAQASETEWLPLGVFAVSRDQATDSNVLLQLAVDKERRHSRDILQHHDRHWSAGERQGRQKDPASCMDFFRRQEYGYHHGDRPFQSDTRSNRSACAFRQREDTAMADGSA